MDYVILLLILLLIVVAAIIIIYVIKYRKNKVINEKIGGEENYLILDKNEIDLLPSNILDELKRGVSLDNLSAKNKYLVLMDGNRYISFCGFNIKNAKINNLNIGHFGNILNKVSILDILKSKYNKNFKFEN